MKTNSKGFTLIELLVVISIVGLLSSVVLASLKTARESARLSSAKQFSSSFHNTVGSEVIGRWDFDEPMPSPIPSPMVFGDSSASSASVSATGGVTIVPGVKGNALHFDGTGRVDTTTVNLPQPNKSGKYSVNAWIRIGPSSTYMTITNRGNSANVVPWASFGYYGSGNQLYIYPGNGAVGGPHVYSSPISIEDNQWHNVAVSVRVGSPIKFYVDGKDVSPSSASYGETTFDLLPYSFQIGHRNTGTEPFIGDIDEVRIYSQPFEWLK